ncbi:MAG: hypothetical protein Q8R13_04755 [bacterium]|nr:hypothetical protein [bacterium]
MKEMVLGKVLLSWETDPWGGGSSEQQFGLDWGDEEICKTEISPCHPHDWVVAVAALLQVDPRQVLLIAEEVKTAVSGTNEYRRILYDRELGLGFSKKKLRLAVEANAELVRGIAREKGVIL